MNKIKIYEDLRKPPFAEISYDPHDIDSICIAEEEKKEYLNDFFSQHEDVQEVYIRTYSSNGMLVASMPMANRQRKLSSNKPQVKYCFVAELNKPIKSSVYRSLQTARTELIEYFKKYHDEFEHDEIIEIINDLIGMGEYQINKTKYSFKEVKD